jgi:hypothetical protein
MLAVKIGRTMIAFLSFSCLIRTAPRLRGNGDRTRHYVDST